MKKIYLMTFLLGFSLWGFGQTIERTPQHLVGKTPKTPQAMQNKTFDRGFEKNISCVDTLYYPMIKEYALGTPTFYNIEGWPGESGSQTYLNSESIMVTGILFYADTSGTASTNLSASLYNVDASYLPTTQIAGTSGTVTVTGFGEYNVTFPTPVTVTGNFAVVIADESGNYFKMLSNAAEDYGAGEGMSSYNMGSGWSPFVDVFGVDNDLMIHPAVSYNITTSFIASDYDVCLGTEISLTGSYTPASTMTNRMFNYNAFSVYYALDGDTLYAWDYGDGSADYQINPTTHTYTTSGTYNAAFVLWGGFWENCLDYYEAPITVYDNPTIGITATETTICSGSTSTLTGTGADSYAWSTLESTNSIVVSPTANTTYSVTGTASGCTGSASIEITVNPKPTITASATPSTLCTGQSTILEGGGGVTYNWDNSLGAGNSHTVTPLVSTIYSVTGTDNNNCTNSASVNVNVAPCTHPTASLIATDNDICVGQSITYTDNSSGVNVDTWAWTFAGGDIAAAGTQGPHIVTYNTAGNHTVTLQVTDDNGTDDTTITIVVHDLPNVTADASVNPVCSGTPTNLNAYGAATYIWNGGSSANPYSVSPTGTTTYTVTGTDANGCQNAATVTINVLEAPIVTAAANPTSVCPGGSSVLTASGNALGYVWDGSATNPITVNPTTTTTYTVTGANASACTATASVTVTVLTAPTITATATPAAVCEGGSSVLTAGGGATYMWTGSVSTNPYTVTPASTTTYSVTGTDGSGCSATNSVTVTVNPLPTVSVVFPPELATVCKDSLVALSGGSPAGGVWSGTGVSGSNFLANTTGSFTITYTYTDGNSCSNSATGDITVENCTSISEYSSNEMVVYPNPASDVITISFGKVDASQVEITLFDLSGRLVSNEVLNLNGSSVEVSVNQLPAGVYTLKVKAGTDVFFTKITRL